MNVVVVWTQEELAAIDKLLEATTEIFERVGEDAAVPIEAANRIRRKIQKARDVAAALQS